MFFALGKPSLLSVVSKALRSVALPHRIMPIASANVRISQVAASRKPFFQSLPFGQPRIARSIAARISHLGASSTFEKTVSTPHRLARKASKIRLGENLLSTAVVRVPLEDGSAKERANEDADDDVACRGANKQRRVSIRERTRINKPPIRRRGKHPRRREGQTVQRASRPNMFSVGPIARADV